VRHAIKRMFAADSINRERRNSAGKSSVMILQGLVRDIIYGTLHNHIRRARGFIVALHAFVIIQPRINFVKLHYRLKKKEYVSYKMLMKCSYFEVTVTVIVRNYITKSFQEFSYRNYFCRVTKIK